MGQPVRAQKPAKTAAGVATEAKQEKKEKDNKQGEDKQVKQKEEVTLVPAKQPSVNAWAATSVATVEAATTEEKGNKQVWPTLKDAVVEESDSAPNASTQSTPAQKKNKKSFRGKKSPKVKSANGS